MGESLHELLKDDRSNHAPSTGREGLQKVTLTLGVTYVIIKPTSVLIFNVSH